MARSQDSATGEICRPNGSPSKLQTRRTQEMVDFYYERTVAKPLPIFVQRQRPIKGALRCHSRTGPCRVLTAAKILPLLRENKNFFIKKVSLTNRSVAWTAAQKKRHKATLADRPTSIGHAVMGISVKNFLRPVLVVTRISMHHFSQKMAVQYSAVNVLKVQKAALHGAQRVNGTYF